MERRAHASELAQGLVEYALIIVMLAIVVMIGLSFLGEGIKGGLYNNIIANL
jgi:Flp pilus assembly pilin Flp